MSFDAFWELKARSLPVEEPEALARAVWDHCHSVLTPTETTEGLQAELQVAKAQLDELKQQIAELRRERDEAKSKLDGWFPALTAERDSLKRQLETAREVVGIINEGSNYYFRCYCQSSRDKVCDACRLKLTVSALSTLTDKGEDAQKGACCPECGAVEVPADTPRTVYACGSSDYDQRPGSFLRGGQCATPEQPAAQECPNCGYAGDMVPPPAADSNLATDKKTE